MIARSGFKVGNAPSNNKVWKSCFFFVSAFRGWGFSFKWIVDDVDNSPPFLLKYKAEQVVRLREILSSSKAIKSMSEGWLVEAGLISYEKGSNRHQDKVVSQPLSMRDLCRVRARSQDKPFFSQEMAYISELSREASLEAWWAESLLAGEQHVAPKRARATIVQYKETLGFKLSLEKIGQVSYGYRYRVALAHCRARYLMLEIEDDPYATLPEDDNVPMEVEVPFNDNHPLAT
ncbi:hypothetical protein GW17_00013581 [Ensete ventricosum]|nr:hypothetical protein GW17_00013581 [Ensete ventricosum]